MKLPDEKVDCKGCILSPGYIDVQLNGMFIRAIWIEIHTTLCIYFFIGGFGVDFTTPSDVTNGSIQKVAKGILKYGCTSFCPTIITSKPETYKQVDNTSRILIFQTDHSSYPTHERNQGRSRGNWNTFRRTFHKLIEIRRSSSNF